MQEFGLTHTNIANLPLANLHWHEMKTQATHVNHSVYPPGYSRFNSATHHHPQTWPVPGWVFPGNPEYWLPGKVLAAQPVLGGNRCVGYGQPRGPKTAGTELPPGPKEMPGAGCHSQVQAVAGGMVAGLTQTGWTLLQHSHGKGVGIGLSG